MPVKEDPSNWWAVYVLVADNGSCPVCLTAFIFRLSSAPFHRCGNNNPTTVLMGSLSTLCPLPLIDCFNFKNNPSYLFIFGLFISRKGVLSVAGRSRNSNFPESLPTKKCRMSLIMAFASISLSPSLHWLSLFTFSSGSQSVSHCILQSEEIGQIDRHLAFHVKKYAGVQRLSCPFS